MNLAHSEWNIPLLETAGDLADWLGVTPNELAWFADLKRLQSRASQESLQHYRYKLLVKRSGRVRLIEAPKERLKAVQRRILTGILNAIPPHDAAHGFRHGRSIRTFAAPHTGQAVVLRMGLADFFPAIRARRVQNMFRAFGYPGTVADLLGGICTNIVPHHCLRITGDTAYDNDVRQLYSRPHLPQGAPTSPALANLYAYRADCRLNGLAKTSGAAYTRYADDLAFSGGSRFASGAERFSIHAAAILLEEGLTVNHRKTRIMRQGVRQHLAGLSVNQHVNVIRADFDHLKATLHNCVMHGPDTQNREGHPDFRAHLDGRVAFMESVNPEKARRLRRFFDAVKWG